MANSLLTDYFNSKTTSTSTATTSASVKTGNSLLANYFNSKNTTTTLSESTSDSTNNGGILGGIGYTFEKIGLGILQSIEGIWDYTASGIAKLFGADDWAEEQVANDWVNYNHADEWYNPSSAMSVVGDVASGIGTSLPAIAAVAAATVISGGTLTPAAATLVSSSIAGLSAAGTSLKEAYQTTGELGLKEYGYATASGVVEGVIEGAEDILGFGSGTVIDNIATTFSKRTAGVLAKNSIGTTLAKSFVGEALEEGISEIISPYLKRMTIDPDAENATLSEVGYAALIGGLSGMAMGGFSSGVTATTNIVRGNSIINKGSTDSVLQTAANISARETTEATGYESAETVSALYNELKTSMDKTGGQITTIKQKQLLGQLERANTAFAFEPMVTSSAQQIYANAETVAEKMNGYYKDADGNPITVTAAELTAGIDATNDKTLRKTLTQALKTNSKLRGLAIVDATGRLTMDTKAFADATLRGEALFNQSDLNRFVETASDQELNAVGERLGIEDWNALTEDELKGKIIQFAQDGGIDSYKTENATVKQLITQAEATTEAKKNLPRRVNLQEDGVYRYTTEAGIDIAITKQGDSYRVYDYTDKRMSKSLTKQELNKVLQTIHAEQEVRIQEQTAYLERQQQAQQQAKEQAEAQQKAQAEAQEQARQQENERQKQARELDEYARKNVKGYNKLSAANQSMIRSVLRQGRLAGIEESRLISIANVSAHSGLNILFSKEKSFVAANGTYADGAVDLRNNRIIINPEAKTRTHEMILIHELTHVIYNLKDGTLQVAEGLKAMSAEEKENIRKRYSKVGQTSSIIIADEINAHFAEQTLSNKNILERLVADKPTVKERILNFFKGAKSDYEGDAKLSKAAEKLYKQYKKLFDDFSASNYQNNAVDTTRALKVDESGKVTFMDEKGQTAQTEAEDSLRYSLEEALKSLETYSDSEIASIEKTSIFKVARSYSDVEEFILKAKEGVEEQRLFLGKLSLDMATKIQEATGLDVQGKSFALSSSDIKHIFDGHGTGAGEQLRGQIPVTQENFENVIETLISPDTITRSDRNGGIGIQFEKSINGYVTAITIVSNKKETLTLKSAWIQKNKQPTSLTHDVQASRLTSETGQRIKTASNNSISDTSEKSNTKTKKSSKKVRYALSEEQEQALTDRGVEGDKLLDVIDLSDEIQSVGGEITQDAKAVLYHATTAENAKKIIESGKMYGKEPNLYFSTKSDGEILGYGDTVIQAEIPLEKLEVNDVFDKEIHLTMAVKPYQLTNIRYALPTTDSDGRTLTEEQQDYFKDSKVRDKDGNLLVMYHGSPATDITKFNIESGTYFTANKDYATRYKKGGKVYEVYLNITNPFDTRNAKEKRIFENEFYGQWGNGARLTENGVPDWTDGYDLVEFIQQKGYKYDGVIVDEGADYGFFGDIVLRGLSYIVFDKQNQVKNVTNTAPTADNDIRFALPEVDPVEPTSNAWKPTIDTYEAKARFPSLWDVTADSSEVRNPTQIKSTVSTYRKIYDYLKRNNFDGTILDASSGLGYGTKAGIEEYGFKVDDIEPYPDANYKPKYTDYSTLNKKYDVIISNAVLNVLPQDQRDALVIKMGELLKDGGTMFINVRGEDVNTLSSNADNVKISEREWFVASTGSYQKGFTKNELVAYLRDALGDNYTVEKANFFGGVAVTVTKNASNVRFALANDEQNDYNSQRGDENNGRTDETNGRTQEKTRTGNSVYIEERQSISILLNNGRVKSLREVVTDEETAQRIEANSATIYSEPHTETQENLLWHAKNEDITLYFVKLRDNAQEAHIYYRENLFISDTASEQMLVDILNVVKPLKRTIDANKIAHISEERWTKFLSRYPNAYLAQVPIQQFLDMTTESYVDQRQIYARSSKISKNTTIDDIRKNSGEDIYLRIDLKNNAVIDHEGRHRMTALLNNGNGNADIFVILDNGTNADLYENLEVKGQFNSNKYNLNLVSANSKEFETEINAIFRTEDGNIRYALPETDSQGNTLTARQREYFKDSKVVDENGNLRVMYHGTTNNFFAFNLFNRGTNGEALGVGYYFTYDKDTAKNYGRKVLETYVNIKKPISINALTITKDEWETYLNYAKEHIDEYMPSRSWQGNELHIESELRDFERQVDTLTSDTDYIKIFLNSISGGSSVVTEAYLQMLTDSIGYDGVVTGDASMVVAFNPNQIKLISNNKPTTDVDIRYALSDDTDSKYSYAELTAKPDMELTILKDNAVPKLENGKINKALVKAKALANVRKQNNPLNTDEFVYAHNNDADTDIRVTASKLKHGFDRRIEINAKATVIIGDLIRNAIKVNEVNSLKTGHTDDYVLLSAFSDSESTYAVGIYVDRVTNEINGFDSVDILYSVNGKEIGTAAPNAADSRKNLPSTTVPTISIAELLEKSNTKFKDIFSKDVYAHFGTEKDTNTKLGSTTRYALPEDTDDTKKPKYTLSAGQIKKTLADYTQERSYTKAQAESIINSVLSSDLFEFGDRYGDMSKKSKAQAIDTLWQSLNTAKTQAELEQVLTDTADYIIQNMALESIYNDEANQAYVDTIDALKPYLHGLNLGSLRGEIKSKYGAKNTVYALWSAGKNKGIGVDVLQQELAAKGFTVEGDTTADILFNIVDAYSNAVEHLQKQAQEMLSTAMSSEQLEELQFDISVSLLRAIGKTGNQTTYAKLPNKSDIKALSDLAQKLFEQNTQTQKQIDSLKAEIKELEKKATQLRNEAADAKDKNNSLREQLRLRDARAVEAQKKALEAQLEEQQAKLQAALEKQEKAFKKRLQSVTDKYKSEAARWKNKYQESKAYNSEVNKVLYKTKKLKGVVVGERLSATQFKGTNFKSTIGQLARIEYRGDFNTSGTRRVFSSLAAWYTPDNPILMTNSEDGSSAYYNAEVAAMLKAVAGNEKPLTQAQSDKIAALMEQSGAKTYKELQAWYTIKNLKSKYNAETKDLIKELASPTTYTVAELQQINNIVSYFTHFIETYNRIYRNGALVDALPVAQENIRIINDNKNVKLPLASRLVNAVFNHQKDANGKGLGSYMDTFADPMTVARNHDQYQNGFYTQTLTEFREAMVGTTITEMQMRANIEEFYDEHKQWYKELQKRTVEYNGAKLSAMQAMTMYLTLKRRQAQAGLAVSGFKFINQDGTTTRINGFAPGLDLYSITPDELNDLAITEQQKLYNSLTETDREYLKLVEDMFNNQDNEYSSKSLKYKTDMKLNGYSNVLEDYYFPIYRAFIGKTIDSSLYQGEIDRVSNLGFNKNTVTGAKGELYIEPITSIIDTHIKGIAMYANMATAIRDYDILFNLDIGGNPNKTVSLRTETENDWRNADRYFKTLLSDMQGISPVKGGTGIMGRMRSNYAKSVLGLNPKVWVTQLSSIFASTSRLDYASIMKASTLIASQTSDIDEYCLLAKARNTENTAALAQGVLETTGKIGDVLMKPIGTMDRFVVKWVYAAAQVQVEKEQGLKVGTKENKVAAGKLTQELILETQQNAMATERSAAMRSGSELLKSLTMFSSDAMKVIGRVIDAFGEHSVLKARLKTTTDATVKAQLEARLKEVNKSLRKSLGALVASSIFMALVAQAFRSLYNKDKDIEDDEDYGLQVLKNMSLDAVGNLMGGLPILKDLYSYLADGYDIEDYSYSTINDLLSSVGDLVDLAEDLFSGSLTSRDVASNIKTVLFNLGKVVGLPVRQTYNLFYGLTSRISESTAYKIDDAFKQQSYVSDLTTAIEKEDMTLAGTIMELLLEDRTDADLSDTAMSKLLELYQAGYTSILPKSISTSITYNGETLTLTSSQLKAFENTYYAVNDVLETMIGSTTFNSLSEEQQAKAVQLLYNAYYYKALSELVEEDSNTTVGTLSNYMDADKAAMAYAVVATATSEKDSDGNTISGSKKASIISALQKQGLSDGEILFILCYSAGYAIQDGDYKNYTAKRTKRLLLNYILKLNVTQAEKAAIAAECGFTVKNNRIITSDL